MGQEGRYNLTNDEFHAKISTSFKAIYQDKKYTDVTLATSEGKQIEAHKVILSSFSPFFLRKYSKQIPTSIH